MPTRLARPSRLEPFTPTNTAAPVDPRVTRASRNEQTRAVANRRVTLKPSDRKKIVRERVYRPSRNTVRDSQGNLPSVGHAARIVRANDRIQEMRRDHYNRTFEANARARAQAYRLRARPDVLRRLQQARAQWQVAPAQWTAWYDYGFYGGYYWDLGADFDISESYVNPVISYYCGDGTYDGALFDAYYGQDWSSSLTEEAWYIQDASPTDYDLNPQNSWRSYQAAYQERFPFAGVFLPTLALRELLLGVSVMDMNLQLQFRLALQEVIRQMTKRLEKPLGPGFQFAKNDIIVTHFRVSEGLAIVLEGTAGNSATSFPFKALLNLTDASKSLVFIALSTKPKSSEIKALDQLNSEIDLVFHREDQALEYVPLEYGFESSSGNTK